MVWDATTARTTSSILTSTSSTSRRLTSIRLAVSMRSTSWLI